MGSISDGLQPEKVFKYFEEISKIPRCSGSEKAISDYLVSFAKSRGLEVIQDRALNVIIKKPGTAGYENAPAVIIQGHMDMVCDKNKDTIHDFEKDPIKLRVEGDMLYADGTTLGADDGIAVAYGMALLDSDDIPHPPLEVLITTEEETGLEGATSLDPKVLNGRRLINIDSEEEGYFLVSCAGGIRVKHSLKIAWEDAKSGLVPYIISIRGLKGGHSGADIHLGRGNSNKLMGRLLNGISERVDYYIKDINGGFKNNAIPREADTVILIKPDDAEKLVSAVSEWEGVFKNELKTPDPGIHIMLKKSDEAVQRVLSRDTKEKAIASLILIPNGVLSMSADIEGLVESSTNLGVVTTLDGEITFDSAIRSSVRSLKYNIMDQSRILANTIGAEFSSEADYPEWEYNPDSKLRSLFERVYEQMHGTKPKITAIHAGLECGLFKEKMPELDMISMGPDMYDVHTPDEHISISSIARVWEFLLSILREMK